MCMLADGKEGTEFIGHFQTLLGNSLVNQMLVLYFSTVLMVTVTYCFYQMAIDPSVLCMLAVLSYQH